MHYQAIMEASHKFVISQDEVPSFEKISKKLFKNSDVKIKMPKLLMMK
jgi:hypothetical protein